ncbi:hypothetical protein BN1723_019494, partial [Verticillium longisporum]
HC